MNKTRLEIKGALIKSLFIFVKCCFIGYLPAAGGEIVIYSVLP